MDKTNKEALGYFALGGLIAIGVVVSVAISLAHYLATVVGFFL